MKQTLVIITLLFITACSSSIDISQPISSELVTDSNKGGYSTVLVTVGQTNATRSFANSLSNKINQNLQELSLLKEDTSVFKVSVELTTYNMNTSNAREVLGVLAGSNKLGSTVKVIDTTTDKVIGESLISTSDALGLGGADGLTWTHADDIAHFLSAN